MRSRAGVSGSQDGGARCRPAPSWLRWAAKLRLRPKTDKHDFDVKLGRARGFLAEGDKVQVNMMFRGRELAHIEVGREVMKRFTDALVDVAKIERPPLFEGKRMTLVLTKK